MIDDINKNVKNLFSIARNKHWEPLVFTYETSPKSQVSMLVNLSKHISIDAEETWRNLATKIKGIDLNMVRKVKFYDSKTSAEVADHNTSYREALCKEANLWEDICHDQRSP